MVETDITEKTETKRNVRAKPKDTTQPTQKTNEIEVHFTINLYVKTFVDSSHDRYFITFGKYFYIFTL